MRSAKHDGKGQQEREEHIAHSARLACRSCARNGSAFHSIGAESASRTRSRSSYGAIGHGDRRSRNHARFRQRRVPHECEDGLGVDRRDDARSPADPWLATAHAPRQFRSPPRRQASRMPPSVRIWPPLARRWGSKSTRRRGSKQIALRRPRGGHRHLPTGARPHGAQFQPAKRREAGLVSKRWQIKGSLAQPLNGIDGPSRTSAPSSVCAE